MGASSAETAAFVALFLVLSLAVSNSSQAKKVKDQTSESVFASNMSQEERKALRYDI